jgi:hypothetical protein
LKAIQSSQASYLSHKGRDILYRMFTFGLPTGNKLKHYPNARPLEDQCPLCHQPNEDTIHCIWSCPQVKRIWQKVFSIFRPPLKRELEQAHVWDILTAKVFQNESYNDIWKIILSETLQAIWWRRCQKKYSDTTLYPMFLLNHIIIKIQLAFNNHKASLDKKRDIEGIRKLIGLLTRDLNIAIVRANGFIITRV